MTDSFHLFLEHFNLLPLNQNTLLRGSHAAAEPLVEPQTCPRRLGAGQCAGQSLGCGASSPCDGKDPSVPEATWLAGVPRARVPAGSSPHAPNHTAEPTGPEAGCGLRPVSARSQCPGVPALALQTRQEPLVFVRDLLHDNKFK